MNKVKSEKWGYSRIFKSFGPGYLNASPQIFFIFLILFLILFFLSRAFLSLTLSLRVSLSLSSTALPSRRQISPDHHQKFGLTFLYTFPSHHQGYRSLLLRTRLLFRRTHFSRELRRATTGRREPPQLSYHIFLHVVTPKW